MNVRNRWNEWTIRKILLTRQRIEFLNYGVSRRTPDEVTCEEK